MSTFISISNRGIVLLAVLASGCGGHGTPTTTTPTAPGSPAPPAITVLRISGPATIAPGATARFTATAAHADGSSEDVTTAATWGVFGVFPFLQQPTEVLQFVSPGTAQAVFRGEVAIQADLRGAKSAFFAVLVLEPGTFKVSGTVTDGGAGRAGPLTGATIAILSGTGAGLSATSNYQGRYALYGAAGGVEVRASANGFEPETHRLVVTDSTADDFGLTPLVMPADVSGSWTVTLSASPSCRGSLPDMARERAFDANITRQSTFLRIVLTSPTTKNLCSNTPDTPGAPIENPGRILGAALSFVIFAEEEVLHESFDIPCMVDSLTPTESLGIYGTVSGTVTGFEIHGSLDGHIDYYSPAQPWVGNPQTQCSAPDHAMAFRRR